MLNVDITDVRDEPFPHVMKHGILPPDLYADLRADFPGLETFAEQGDESSGVGSRVGKGTGFDIYRGDSAYDRLIGSSPAWATFDAWINSPAFVEKFLELFGNRLDDLGCKVEVDPSAYDRDLVEGREVLTDKATTFERIGKLGRKIFGSSSKDKDSDVTLFSRLDIEKSIGGYSKPPHCDRANRLCSLIIYFSDLAGKDVGGDLNVYALKEQRPLDRYDRHPDPKDVEKVASVVPQQNLGVFFPCSNNSYHGVNALTDQTIERDFLYINISTETRSAW